jgi:tetratricopeptide (TPR) repeat protein
MRKKHRFLVFLMLWTLLVSCCVDQTGTDSKDGVSSTTETPFTLAEKTKTTLVPAEAEEDRGLADISRMVESGRLDEALVLSQKTPSPSVYVYLNNAGVNYTREKKYEQADKVFSSILKAYPNQPDVWYNKGLVDAELGRYEDAVNAFNNATELKPEDAAAWHQKASCLYYLKRYEDAVEACNRSLALEPGNANVWYNMGIALTDLKRYNESIKAYDRALAIKPDYAEAENNKGNALSELGQYKEAIVAYDRALAIRDDEQTKKNREMAQIKYNETKQAISKT